MEEAISYCSPSKYSPFSPLCALFGRTMMTLDGNVILLSHHNLTQIKSMDKNHSQNQPLDIEICRVRANQNTPLQPVNTPCITIGYLIAGRKYLYHNNEITAIEQNSLFIIGLGEFYEENIVNNTEKFEQITFQISPQRLQEAMLGLSFNLGFSLSLYCPQTNLYKPHILTTSPSEQLRKFFEKTNDVATENNTRKRIRLNELIYLLATSGDAEIKALLLRYSDSETMFFMTTIYEKIFTETSAKELAALTNRSLTSFKKEFKGIFGMPPHRWIVEKRLERARMLLISTNKTVSEVGTECGFANISHFIKLFKRRFGTTPKTLHKVG